MLVKYGYYHFKNKQTESQKNLAEIYVYFFMITTPVWILLNHVAF